MANYKEILTGITGIWDLGFGIWDLGFGRSLVFVV
jgi:hypothetical protein